ncbi:MAG: zinc ribbon domain-containing protein [Anaerolineae bacterium]|nr:zinc ribbon domain-containing protein [Anaerolineae bacterium]
MTLPANLDVYISAAMFVLGAYFIALYVGLIVWTFRDIHGRTRDVLGQIMATLLVAVFTLPGLVIYLLLRPHETLSQQYERTLAEEALLQDLDQRHVCPNCQLQIEPDFVVCPHCHQQLRLRCVGCKRLLHLEWDVCPYCGLYRDQDQAGEIEGDAQGEREAQPIIEAGDARPPADRDEPDLVVIAPDQMSSEPFADSETTPE